ncbi:site-2 protease family protein [Chlamydiota bacterium]
MNSGVQIVFSLCILFFSVIIHEVAHGFVALWCGDPTARDSGRLTLNPVSHIDLVGTIILPIILFISVGFAFGWAKPVPINPYNFRNPKKDTMLVGLSGPLSNIILALITGLLLRMGLLGIIPIGRGFVFFLLFASVINIILALFNLIPIPPLDGSRILMGFLPHKQALFLSRIEPYGMLIVLVLLMAGIFQHVIMPLARILLRIIIGSPGLF